MTDKQKVSELESITNSYNDQHLMVITDLYSNQLSKQKISDFIKDIISDEQENSVLTAGDGKIFCLDTSNADNISSGTLDEERLPKSGVTEGVYQYPVDLKVNDKGQIVSVSAGQPGGNNADASLSNLNSDGEKHFLNKSQITNCILEAPNGVATSNGSTVTVKQGLRVLIPNGRNADNSLNNIEYIIEEDLSKTYTNSTTYNAFLILQIEPNGIAQYLPPQSSVLRGKTSDIPQNFSGIYFDTDANTSYTYTNGIANNINTVIIASAINNPGNISLETYYPVELLKRTDFSELAGLSAPSGEFIEYTLLASGKSYEAPANGYFYLNKVAGIQNAYATMYSGGIGKQGVGLNTTSNVLVSIYCEKGASCIVNYNATGTTNLFRFIPAKGEIL